MVYSRGARYFKNGNIRASEHHTERTKANLGGHCTLLPACVFTASARKIWPVKSRLSACIAAISREVNEEEMNKKQIKSKVTELLSSGQKKSEVFAQLSGHGVKDRYLAHYIASYADPLICYEHDGKKKVLIALMCIQAALGFIYVASIGGKSGAGVIWLISSFVALFPLLFAWAFHKHVAGAYNLYIFLSIIHLPKQFAALSSMPVTTSIGLAIGIGTLALVLYLRSKIFPDFAFISPKKIGGRYVFSS